MIDIPGLRFNEVLNQRHQASPADVERFAREDAWWEGCIPGSDVALGVDLTGIISVISGDEKYSQIRHWPASQERVLNFERILRELLPMPRIVRIDEYLLENWEKLSGEFWYRDSAKSDEFFEWIKSQDPEAWLSL